MYLNQIFYGNRSYGIEAAAQTYFHKSAAELNLSEASLLAGIPQQPTNFNPALYPGERASAGRSTCSTRWSSSATSRAPRPTRPTRTGRPSTPRATATARCSTTRTSSQYVKRVPGREVPGQGLHQGRVQHLHDDRYGLAGPRRGDRRPERPEPVAVLPGAKRRADRRRPLERRDPGHGRIGRFQQRRDRGPGQHHDLRPATGVGDQAGRLRGGLRAGLAPRHRRSRRADPDRDARRDRSGDRRGRCPSTSRRTTCAPSTARSRCARRWPTRSTSRR